MTADDLRRLWHRDLDPATLTRMAHHERQALLRLSYLVRRRLLLS